MNTLQAQGGGDVPKKAMLLDIFRMLQRLESRMDGQDDHLNKIELELSVYSVPSSPTYSQSLQAMTPIGERLQSNQIPLARDIQLSRSNSVPTRSRYRNKTKFEFHDSASDLQYSSDKEKEPELQVGFLGLPGPGSSEINLHGDVDSNSISVYSEVEATTEPSTALSTAPTTPHTVEHHKGIQHMSTNAGRISQGSSQRVRDSSDSIPISIAYADVKSAPWRSVEDLASSPKKTMTGRFRVKPSSHEQLAIAFEAYDSWREEVKSRMGDNPDLAQEIDWAKHGALHVQDKLKASEKRMRTRLLLSNIERIWISAAEFVKRHGKVIITGWVMV